MRRDLVEDRLGMAVRGVDDDAVDAGRHQQFARAQALVADGRRGGDAQPPFRILAAFG